MQANVKGTTMPVLEMVLEPGEAIISTHGDLSWMTANMQLSQTTNTGGGGGIMAGLKRMAGGGGLFLTRYEATGGPGDGDLRQQGSGPDLPHRHHPRSRLRRPSPRLGVRHARDHALGGAPAVVPGRPVGWRGVRPPEARGRGPGLDRALGRDRRPTSWRPASRSSSIPGHVGMFHDTRDVLGHPAARHRQPVHGRRRAPSRLAHRARHHLAAVDAACRSWPRRCRSTWAATTPVATRLPAAWWAASSATCSAARSEHGPSPMAPGASAGLGQEVPAARRRRGSPCPRRRGRRRRWRSR